MTQRQRVDKITENTYVKLGTACLLVASIVSLAVRDTSFRLETKHELRDATRRIGENTQRLEVIHDDVQTLLKQKERRDQ